MNVFAHTYFTDPQGTVFRLDFLKVGHSGPTREITGTGSPFKLKLPNVGHKFQVVCGTGCKLKLNSPSDRALLDLYTIQMQDIQLRFYREQEMIWCGWLDSELYEEDYSEYRNYPVNLTGNDGLNLLSRINFIQDNGKLFTGEMKMFDVLKSIIGKLGLPYKKLYLLSGTKIVVSESEKLGAIEHLSILTDNYLDKDKKPLSLREVLEEMFKPFGLQLKCSNGNIWIMDTHHQAQKGIISAVCYDLENNWSRSELQVNLIKDISAIGFYQTGGTLKKMSGYNEQEITYSPKVTPSLGAPKVEDTKMWDKAPQYSFWKRGRSYMHEGHAGSHTQVLYETLKKSTGNSMSRYFTFLNDYADLQGIQGSGTNKEDPTESNHLALINPNYNRTRPTSFNPQWSVKYIPHQYIIGNEHTMLRISFEAFVLTSENPFDDQRDPVLGLNIPLKVTIGSKSIDLTYNWEQDSSNYIYAVVRDKKAGGDIAEKWTKVTGKGYSPYANSRVILSDTGIVLPVPPGLSGEMLISFASNIKTFRHNQQDGISNHYKTVREVQIKNIKVELVEPKGKAHEYAPIKSNDITYTGKMNHYFKEKGKEIKIIHGTSISAGEKGALIFRSGDTSSIVNTFERAGVQNKIEKLLLRSIMSNYKRAHLGLTSIRLNNDLMVHQTITDSRVFGNKVFRISGGSIDYYNGCAEVSMVEVFEDTEEIIESQNTPPINQPGTNPSDPPQGGTTPPTTSGRGRQ
ncbi:hypothetical protein K5X82_07410 [Halosquirtibacter xylanolyticus]|uniref:hypothetical protein n=1 Tax=Halosquirtibacter xylanolyticus TaxID=3374599 RepID=UPI003748061B|nr:hypothetical protein K5X82_07410 [Prolixibacteraceae bacterium]